MVSSCEHFWATEAYVPRSGADNGLQRREGRAGSEVEAKSEMVILFQIAVERVSADGACG